MSRFVELWHEIIENRWKPAILILCFRRDEINIPQRQELLGFASMSDEQREWCPLCLWLFFGDNKLPYANFWQ